MTKLQIEITNSQLYLNGTAKNNAMFLTISYDLDLTIRLSRVLLMDQSQEEKRMIKLMDEQQYYISPSMRRVMISYKHKQGLAENDGSLVMNDFIK